MSRDFTCNETMPALDDGDGITDVRRMVPSRIIGQQQFSSLNLMAGNRSASNNGSAAPNMTVRDVVSNRIRNRGNEPIVTSLSSNIHQAPAPQISSFSTKPIGVAETVSANNLLNSIFHDTTRPAANTNPPAGKYINISINNNINASMNSIVQQQQSQPQQQQQSIIRSTTAGQPQYIVSTSTIPVQRIAPPVATGATATAALYRQQAPPAAASTAVDVLPQTSQKIGISIAYDTATMSNNAVAQPILISNSGTYVNNNGTSAVVQNVRVQPSATTQNLPTGYVIPPSASTIEPAVVSSASAAGFTTQQAADSPSKPIYLNRQPNSSASPSPVVFSTTSHYLQQVHPSSSRTISAYPPEMTVGSVVRASGSNSNFIIAPLTSAVSGNGNSGGVLSRGASPYAVVMSRSESVLRESPNGMSNHGSTTPNGSQPPNSHSSPRPSILRGNSAVRRVVERDATPVSSVTHFAAVNFTDHGAPNVPPVNFYTSTATSSSMSNDGMTNDSRADCMSNYQDDSPRKRQRKQQFDNSQLQDKLMMKVHTDPRHEQLAAENAGTWNAGGPIQSIMSKNTYSSGDYGATLGAREPRRRGRPRSVNRSAELQQPTSSRILINTHNIGSQSPTMAGTIGVASVVAGASLTKSAAVGYVTALPANNHSSGSISSPTVVAYGTAPPPPSAAAVTALVADNGAGDATVNNLAAPRSFMVDVDDRMLQVPLGSKRPRKYKKRTPELDPDTGEPVKKPRKKGSGRKSKKDLVLLEAIKREIDVYGGGGGSPTIGEVLVAGANHNPHHMDELQPHLYHQQPPHYGQPVHSGRYATTYVNTSAASGGQPPLAVQSAANGKFVHSPFTSSFAASSATAAATLHARMAVDERRVVATLCQLKSIKAVEQRTADATDSVNAEEADQMVVDEEAIADEPTSTSSKTSASVHRIAVDKDQLLDAAKFRELAALWKTADRNRAVALADDYDEVYEFLAKLRAETATNDDGNSQQMRRWTALNEPCCPIFDSFEDFKRSVEVLKLLPTACNYFKSSRMLLDSLRGNLYGFSAFHLAKKLLIADAAALTKIDTKHVQPLASAGDLQGQCDDLFHFLYDQLKRRMNAPMAERDGAPLNAAKSILIDMSVVDLLDQLIDNVDRTPIKKDDNDFADRPTDQKSEVAALTATTAAIFNPLVSAMPAAAVSATIRRLPPAFRQLLLAGGGDGAARPNRTRQRRRRAQPSTSSESEPGHRSAADDDGSDSEQPSDEKRVAFVFNKLRNFADRSQRSYRLARRQSLRLLSRVEPMRYREFVDVAKASAADNETAVKRLRDDAETSFLMDVPRHKSLFKSLNIYNSTKSITMKPPADVVRRVFQNIDVPCYSTSSSSSPSTATPTTLTAVEIESDENRPSRLKPIATAVDRLRDAEKNFLVAEEIREMELHSAHIVAVAAERLRRKYGDRHQPAGRPSVSRNDSCFDEESCGADDKIVLPHFADFDPSLKRQFPHGASEDVKEQFFKDRCREMHEMAAVVVGLSHTRANILRQCLDSLVDAIGVASSSASYSQSSRPTAATADSDAEPDTMAAATKQPTSGTNVYDYDADSPVGTPQPAIAAGSDSEHSNNNSGADDDHSNEPESGARRPQQRLNVHHSQQQQQQRAYQSNAGRYAANGGPATAATGGIVVGAKKRRWSGYHRQAPVAGPAQPAAAITTSRVALAK